MTEISEFFAWATKERRVTLKHLAGEHDQSTHGHGGGGGEGGSGIASASVGERLAIMHAYHPSGGAGQLKIRNEKQREAIEGLESKGFGKIKNNVFELNSNGMKAAQELIDKDSDASNYYYNIGAKEINL